MTSLIHLVIENVPAPLLWAVGGAASCCGGLCVGLRLGNPMAFEILMADEDDEDAQNNAIGQPTLNMFVQCVLVRRWSTAVCHGTASTATSASAAVVSAASLSVHLRRGPHFSTYTRLGRTWSRNTKGSTRVMPSSIVKQQLGRRHGPKETNTDESAWKLGARWVAESA